MNRSNNMRVILMMAAAVLMGMMIMTGCSDDDDPVTVEGPFVGPETVGELLNLVQTTYETRDLANYMLLLDRDFLMILSQPTIDEFPDLGTTLDFAKEERIHQRMFSGELLNDPQGNLVPGVDDIGFNVFLALDEFSATDDEVNFPDTHWALFEVDITIYRGQQYSALRVQGAVKIYVRTHEVMVGGVNKTYFLMAGMKDMTDYSKGSESVTWGDLKAIYR